MQELIDKDKKDTSKKVVKPNNKTLIMKVLLENKQENQYQILNIFSDKYKRTYSIETEYPTPEKIFPTVEDKEY